MQDIHRVRGCKPEPGPVSSCRVTNYYDGPRGAWSNHRSVVTNNCSVLVSQRHVRVPSHSAVSTILHRCITYSFLIPHPSLLTLLICFPGIWEITTPNVLGSVPKRFSNYPMFIIKLQLTTDWFGSLSQNS